MDIFGIGSAVKAAVEVYFNCARQSGRNTALISSLKAGDTVYFSTPDMANWFRKRLEHEGVEGVKCAAWNWNSTGTVVKSKARAIFHHSVVESLYREAIEDTAKTIARIERELSLNEGFSPLEKKSQSPFEIGFIEREKFRTRQRGQNG